MAETSSTTVCNSKLHLNRAAQAKKKFPFKQTMVDGEDCVGGLW